MLYAVFARLNLYSPLIVSNKAKVQTWSQLATLILLPENQKNESWR